MPNDERYVSRVWNNSTPAKRTHVHALSQAGRQLLMAYIYTYIYMALIHAQFKCLLRSTLTSSILSR